jgi:Flp pilus assembly pilin Flp
LTNIARFLNDEVGKAACECALIVSLMVALMMTALLVMEIMDPR